MFFSPFLFFYTIIGLDVQGSFRLHNLKHLKRIIGTKIKPKSKIFKNFNHIDWKLMITPFHCFKKNQFISLKVNNYIIYIIWRHLSISKAQAWARLYEDKQSPLEEVFLFYIMDVVWEKKKQGSIQLSTSVSLGLTAQGIPAPPPHPNLTHRIFWMSGNDHKAAEISIITQNSISIYLCYVIYWKTTVNFYTG